MLEKSWLDGRRSPVKNAPCFKPDTRFDRNGGGGLTTRDGKPPTWFEVAGSDGTFHPAEAKISANGKSLLLTRPEVPKPDRARFAWSQLAEPNLMNREGLPAAAFNTHWPDDATLGRR